MEGQVAHVPESNAQGNGLKSRSGGITPARQGRHARTQQQADSPQRTGSIEGSAQDSKGEEWDEVGWWVWVRKRRGRSEAGGGGKGEMDDVGGCARDY